MRTDIEINDGLWNISFADPTVKDQLVKGVANGKKTFTFKDTIKAGKGEEFPLENCPLHIIGEEAFRLYDVSVTVKAFGSDAVKAKETAVRKQRMRRALADAKKLNVADMLLFTEGKLAARGFSWPEFDEDQQKAVMAKLDTLQGKPAAGWKSLKSLTTAFINDEIDRDEFERLAREMNEAADKVKAKRAAKVAEPTA